MEKHSKNIEDKPDATNIPVDNGRSSLMEAIRNAGGSSKAGLKSVKERKLEEKRAKLGRNAIILFRPQKW